jgi:hypothetical protein
MYIVLLPVGCFYANKNLTLYGDVAEVMKVILFARQSTLKEVRMIGST